MPMYVVIIQGEWTSVSHFRCFLGFLALVAFSDCDSEILAVSRMHFAALEGRFVLTLPKQNPHPQPTWEIL